MIEFSAPILVFPKQGDRSRIAKTKTGYSYIRHHPNPKQVNNAKTIALFAKPHVPAAPLTGPLQMDLTFVWPWRKTESKLFRAIGSRRKNTKPDLDNLAKQVCDVLESLGFFADDAQISDLHLRKRWGPAPRLDVRLEETA